MRNSKIKDKMINLFISNLKEQFGSQIKKVILFGSRARGDNDPYSDYDLLIVCSEVTERIKKYVNELENEILLSNYVLFSTFIISEREFEEKVYEPYLMNAKKEGILL